MERLFFTSFLLTALCFAEMYITAAHEQFAQDRTLVTISAISKRLSSDLQHLQQLYVSKPDKQPEGTVSPAPPPPKATSERERLVALSRQRLGLSATPTPRVEFKPPSVAPTPIETYSDALRTLIDATIREDNASPEIANRYLDPGVPPTKYLTQLADARASIEKQPIDVWGIKTSRLIEFQYAGSNFQFPYLFVASALIVLLPALMAGWLTSTYMTRQRELNEIAKAITISAVFPHVLNFLPVNDMRASGRTYTRGEETFAIVMEAIMRLTVITVLISPMIVAYAYSLMHVWKFSSAVNLAIPFLLYNFFQIMGIYIQEIIGVRRKIFTEGRP